MQNSLYDILKNFFSLLAGLKGMLCFFAFSDEYAFGYRQDFLENEMIKI